MLPHVVIFNGVSVDGRWDGFRELGIIPLCLAHVEKMSGDAVWLRCEVVK